MRENRSLESGAVYSLSSYYCTLQHFSGNATKEKRERGLSLFFSVLACDIVKEKESKNIFLIKKDFFFEAFGCQNDDSKVSWPLEGKKNSFLI